MRRDGRQREAVPRGPRLNVPLERGIPLRREEFDVTDLERSAARTAKTLLAHVPMNVVGIGARVRH